MSPVGSLDRSPADADRLLALALSRPPNALAEARALLAGRPSAEQASVAHQAIGVVLRDFGDIDQAVRELRTALRWARRAGNPEREADVLASLGVALVMAGQTRRGLSALDEVVEASTARRRGRVHTGRILIRRAWALWTVGRNEEALRDAHRAVALLRDAGDPVWEARAHDHRATVQFALGAVERADQDYARSEALFAEAGQQLEYADTRQERAAAAFARGDIPAALALLDDAHRLVDELGVFEPELFVTKCTVLLAAGLSRDALAEIEVAVERSERQRGSATRRAELLVAAARAAYATGDFAAAERRSRQALALLRRQHRPQWAGRAELVLLSASHAAGDRSIRLLGRARRLAARMDDLDGARSADAHLLAGRLALACGRDVEAEHHLRAAVGNRGRDLHTRMVGCLARATLYESQQKWAAMLAACSRGLTLIDLYLRTLGATELRTEATAQGADLAGIALRHSVRRWDARRVLDWSERWRATALSVPPVRSHADQALMADLAALRHLSRRLDDSPTHHHVAPGLHQERRRLETAVRRRVLRTPAVTGEAVARPHATDLLQDMTDADLIELTDVEGELYAVVAGRRRIGLVRVGSTAAADHALAHTLFALRRGAIGQSRHQLDLEAISADLEQSILGGCTALLDDRPVVMVPTGRLHAVPWALLPSLRDRDLAVSPSATTWVRARRAVPHSKRVVLVGGPRLSSGASEVEHLARQYPQAMVLADGRATADRVLAAMDGAWLVHIAAHGTFRADSPLFSAIELDDGPLTVYDLERLGHAPHRVVLSSCNSAVGAPTGADELLGIVSALISLGSAGVLASVVPVNDPATVPLMLDVHHHLRRGCTLSAAHLMARRSARDDPATRLVGDSFIALGC